MDRDADAPLAAAHAAAGVAPKGGQTIGVWSLLSIGIGGLVALSVVVECAYRRASHREMHMGHLMTASPTLPREIRGT